MRWMISKMRVISHDRCYSYDFDRTMFWKQDGVLYAHVAGDSRDRVLGNYKSDERAEEVFEDMHKALCGETVLFQNVEMPDDFQKKLEDWRVNTVISNIPNSESKIEKIGNHVYYMPKE